MPAPVIGVIALIKRVFLFQILDDSRHQASGQMRGLGLESVSEQTLPDELVPGKMNAQTDRIFSLMRDRNTGGDAKGFVEA